MMTGHSSSLRYVLVIAATLLCVWGCQGVQQTSTSNTHERKTIDVFSSEESRALLSAIEFLRNREQLYGKVSESGIVSMSVSIRQSGELYRVRFTPAYVSDISYTVEVNSKGECRIDRLGTDGPFETP